MLTTIACYVSDSSAVPAGASRCFQALGAGSCSKSVDLLSRVSRPSQVHGRPRYPATPLKSKLPRRLKALQSLQSLETGYLGRGTQLVPAENRSLTGSNSCGSPKDPIRFPQNVILLLYAGKGLCAQSSTQWTIWAEISTRRTFSVSITKINHEARPLAFGRNSPRLRIAALEMFGFWLVHLGGVSPLQGRQSYPEPEHPLGVGKPRKRFENVKQQDKEVRHPDGHAAASSGRATFNCFAHQT